MSETFEKSQTSESFDAPAGCTCTVQISRINLLHSDYIGGTAIFKLLTILQNHTNGTEAGT